MNEENKKKHYLIYQTTNLVNNKIYIGKHITENIEDQYFGSGKYLKRAIEKYGLENFEFKILFELQNEEEMNLLEKCVVTQEFCDRKDTYNINVGGDGGWGYVNNKSDFQIGTQLRIKKFHTCGGIVCQKKYKEQYGSFTKYCLNKMSKDKREELRKIHALNAKNNINLHYSHPINFKHSDKTKKQMSINQLGEKNSQFGTCWIRNDILQLNIKWNKTQVIPDGWKYGRCQNFEKEQYESSKRLMDKINKHLYHIKEQYMKKIFFELFYGYYLKFGYQAMINHFQLDISQSAFCHLCSKRVSYYKNRKRLNYKNEMLMES